MIFVDTGAWYALSDSADPDHVAAIGWLSSNRESLVKSDYVLDETLTLLRRHGQDVKAVEVGRRLLDQEGVSLVHVTPEDVRETFEVFSRYRDKGWSFTDCSSYVIIRRPNLSAAFSFDQHFQQFNLVTVVPHG